MEAGNARLVHKLVHNDSCDDLPMQPVLGHPVGVALSHRTREVIDQAVHQVRVIRQIGGQNLILENDLAVREQRRQLG